MTCIICCLAFMTLMLLLTSMRHNKQIRQLHTGTRSNCHCIRSSNTQQTTNSNSTHIARQQATKLFNGFRPIQKTKSNADPNDVKINDDRMTQTI
jgi:hypothetical protein